MSLTILANEPLTEQSVLYSRTFIEDITANLERYTHIISAVGGFDKASFMLKGTKDYLDDWFEDGLMRRIETINPEGIQIWEGYADSLSYAVGSLVKTKSISNMYNRVHMRYAPLDFSTSPPTSGTPLDIILNDLSSQDDFGIKTSVVSGGERVENTALTWAKAILKDRKNVPIGETVNIGSSGDLSIKVNCLGYWHSLDWIPYENSKTGSIQANEVIREVLEFFNNVNQGWFPQDFGWLDYNFRRERRGRDSLQSCKAVITDIINEGGLAGERWVGGFYQNRNFLYKQAEDLLGLYSEHFDLYRTLADPQQFIFDSVLGTEVKPWDMVPDRILRTLDL